MPAPLVLAGLAAGGFVKGGGLGGIIGGKRRRKEEQAAQVEQRERLYDYENFDFNQDVGPINDPYAQIAQQRQEFEQANIDRASANQLNALQQAGSFGATQAVIGAQADAAAQSAQRIQGLRQQGALFVEQQRQARIGQRYDQTQTLLARSENRLAAAKRARQQATQQLYKGIGAGLTAAAAGGAAGGAFDGVKGNFDASAALKGSGLLPSSTFGGSDLASLLSQASPEELEKLGYTKT